MFLVLFMRELPFSCLTLPNDWILDLSHRSSWDQRYTQNCRPNEKQVPSSWRFRYPSSRCWLPPPIQFTRPHSVQTESFSYYTEPLWGNLQDRATPGSGFPFLIKSFDTKSVDAPSSFLTFLNWRHCHEITTCAYCTPDTAVGLNKLRYIPCWLLLYTQ